MKTLLLFAFACVFASCGALAFGIHDGTGKDIPHTPVVGAQSVTFSCGMKPMPPTGCQIGSCVCDSAGKNCQWQVVCGR